MKIAISYLLLFLLISGLAMFVASFIYLLSIGNGVIDSLGSKSQTAVPIEVEMWATIVADIILFGYFLWRRYCPVSRNYVRSRPLKVVFWCIVAALGTVLPSMWIQEHLSFLPNLSQPIDSLLGSPLGYISVVICAPLCEEVIFRGAVIRSLLEWRDNKKLAIVISAAIFAVAHINPIQIPHVFLAGLLLGWVFVRTNSVVPGIVIHGVNNLAVFVMASSISNIDNMTLADLYGGSTLRATLSVVFSLMILVPAIYQLHRSMKQ